MISRIKQNNESTSVISSLGARYELACRIYEIVKLIEIFQFDRTNRNVTVIVKTFLTLKFAEKSFSGSAINICMYVCMYVESIFIVYYYYYYYYDDDDDDDDDDDYYY